MSINANVTHRPKPGSTRITWHEEYSSWIAEQWNGYNWIYLSHAKEEEELRHWVSFVWDQGLVDTRATD